MKKILSVIMLISGCVGCQDSVRVENNQSTPAKAVAQVAQEPDAVKEADMSLFPEWFRKAMAENGAGQKYKVGTWVEPYFLVGDFDGDGREDVAYLAENKASGEKGVIVVYQGDKHNFDVLGAGVPYEEMTDMDWIGVFEKVPAGETVSPTLIDEESGDILGEDTLNAVVLRTDGIFIHLAEECGGGVVHKVNDKWEWIQIE